MSESDGGGGGGRRTRHLRHSSGHPPPPPAPFHLLEVNLVSAQDLHHAAHHTSAYASVWVHPSHREHTQNDHVGGTDPFWNERFVFPVDDEFLSSATSAVSVDISHSGGCRRKLLGSARLVLSALSLSAGAPPRYVGIQIRRPKSLRPQGIINIGVALLNFNPYYNVGTNVSHRKAVGDDGLVVLGGGSRSWEVGEWAVGRERRAVQAKLEKWKEELSPEHGVDEQPSSGRKKKKKSRVGCFCCSRMDVEEDSNSATACSE